MKTDYELILNQNQIRLNQLTEKLAFFRSIPADLQGIAALDVAELLGYVAKMEKDSFLVYDAIEAAYHKNFFEKVIHRKYGHLFDDDAATKFNDRIEILRQRVVGEIAFIAVGAARELDHYKNLSEDLRRKLAKVQFNYENQHDQATRDAEMRAKKFIEQKEAAMQNQYATDLLRYQQEIQALEDQQSQNDNMIMRMKMKQFLYRWHINTQLKKMIERQKSVIGSADYKELLQDKEYVQTVSYVQEKVNNDLSAEVLKEIKPMRDKLNKYLK